MWTLELNAYGCGIWGIFTQEHNQSLNDKLYSMKLIKIDLYGLMDYIRLVDWAYKYMSKKPHCKERRRLFNLLEKKHCKKQCQDVALRKTKIQEMLFA